MSRVGAILSISQSHHRLTNTAAYSLGCNWFFNLSLEKRTSFYFIQVFLFIRMYPVVAPIWCGNLCVKSLFCRVGLGVTPYKT